MQSRHVSPRRWTALAIAIALPAGLLAVSQRAASPRTVVEQSRHETDAVAVPGMRFMGTVSADGQTRAVFMLPGSTSPWMGKPGERVPGTNLTLQEIRGQKAILAPTED